MNNEAQHPHRSLRHAEAIGTTTITGTQTLNSSQPRTLRLRAEPVARTQDEPERRVQWAEDVVNNEGMGKKRSKVCCIYHKPRAVGESSSDESSSSSSDDDSGSDDDGAARPSNPERKNTSHHHGHDDFCQDHNHNGPLDKATTRKKGKSKAERRSLNAYEKEPRNSATETLNP